MEGNIHVGRHHVWQQQFRSPLRFLMTGKKGTPPQWRYPLSGYLVGTLFVGLGLVIGLLEKHLITPFSFPGLILFSGVVLVSLYWGVKPSILTILLSLLVLDFLYIPPFGGLGYYRWSDIFQLATFAGVGLTIAVFANQREVARLRAVAAERNAAYQSYQLAAIFEAMSDGVVVCDRKGQVVHMNAAARTLFGSQTVAGKDEHLLHQSLLLQATRCGERGQELVEKRRPLARIFRGEVLTAGNTQDVLTQTVNGQTLMFNISGAPVRGENGDIERAVLLYRDVTLHRQLERQTSDALQALLVVAESLVHIPEQRAEKDAPQDTADEVQLVGPRLAELARHVVESAHVVMYAVEQEEDVLTPVAATGFSALEEQQWRASFADNPSLSEQIGSPQLSTYLRNDEIIMLDGMALPLYTHILPYYTGTVMVAPVIAGTSLVGLLCVDAGHKEHCYTRQEMMLVQTIARLTALIFARNRLERERAQARADELVLRETNRQIETFLSVVCHELKTPMTIMHGSLQLAERKVQKLLASEEGYGVSVRQFAPVQGLIERAKSQISILERLVNDLLDVSRTQTQRLTLVVEPCDLVSIVRRAVDAQREVASERAILLDMPEQTVVPVQADADRIHQVVNNYLTNALKYAPSDRPIRVSLSINTQQALVAVRDEGQGLAPSEIERVWERFYRVPGTDVQKGPGIANVGLGVGLYISRAIIELQCGKVGVHSEIGHGSTFWFTLPLHHGNENDAGSSAETTA